MRTFERFLNRRSIKDAHAYFSAMGITTNEALKIWCKSSGIEMPSNPLFTDTTKQERKVSKPKPKAAAKRTSGSEDPETWHIPAAERPLKKPQKKKQPTKKKGGK